MKKIGLVLLFFLFSNFQFSVPVSAAVPSEGLVAQWLAEERYFSGAADDFLAVADSNLPSGTQPVTIAVQFKTGVSLAAVRYQIALSYGTAQPGQKIYFGMGNDPGIQPPNSFFVGPHGEAVSTGVVVNDNNWHQAVATFDGTIWKIYLDGQLKNTKVMTTNIVKTGQLLIGSGIDRNWQGYLSNVLIWDRALSEYEIRQIEGLKMDVLPVYKITTSDTLTINPVCQSPEPDDTFTYNPLQYSFTPVFTDGGTIRTIKFSCTSAKLGETLEREVKVVVFRDFSKLKKYSGNPIIPVTTQWWNAAGISAPFVKPEQKINGVYHSIVQTNNDATNWHLFALYTSTNLIDWTAYSANPVLTHSPGSWDDTFVLHPAIININGLWHLYYSGLAPGTSPEGIMNGFGKERIGLATSSDFIHWDKHPGNPLEINGDPHAGADNYSASIPAVEKVGDNYLLYYHDRINDLGKYAVSTDGINWSYGGIFLQALPGDWDYDLSPQSPHRWATMDPFVMKNKRGFYELIYTLWRDGQWLGYAVSEDGLHWHKFQGPILAGSGIQGSFDRDYVGDGALYQVSDRLVYLYYAGIRKDVVWVSSDLAQAGLAILEDESKTTIFNFRSLFSEFASVFDYNRLIADYGR